MTAPQRAGRSARRRSSRRRGTRSRSRGARAADRRARAREPDRGRQPRGAAFARALRDVAGAADHRRVQAPIAVARDPARATTTPAAHAAAYAAAGAAAISVLTEPTFFDGALEHLAAGPRGGRRPAPAQGLHRHASTSCSRRSALGADAVLLIVGALDDRRAARRCSAARPTLGLAALVEVHDADELARAVDAGAQHRRRQQPQPADARRRPGGARSGRVAAAGRRDRGRRERHPDAARISSGCRRAGYRRVPGRRAADHAAGSGRGAAGAARGGPRA